MIPLPPGVRRRARNVRDRFRTNPWIRAYPPLALKDLGARGAAVALTFDDGPDPAVTTAVLDVLAETGARATFFMCGAAADRDPDVVTAVAEAGHLVAAHSWDHVPLVQLTPEQLRRQIDDTRELLRELSGQQVRYVRPPWGIYDSALLHHLRRRSLTPMLWSCSSEDWCATDAAEVVGRVQAGLAPGAVVLFHDGLGHRLIPPGAPNVPFLPERTDDRTATVNALPAILAAIQDRGLQTERLPRDGDTPSRWRRLNWSASR